MQVSEPGPHGPQGHVPLPQGATLILGGARSGKSRFAEALALQAVRPVYIATAEPHDDEMAARIAQHQARRGAGWITVEEPFELAAAIERLSTPDSAVLVDCLTLWLSNLLCAGRDIAAAEARLLGTLERLNGPLLLVANEVGLGIVPDNALARAFRDHAGRLNQALAARCGHVFLLVAGIPMTVKSQPRLPR